MVPKNYKFEEGTIMKGIRAPILALVAMLCFGLTLAAIQNPSQEPSQEQGTQESPQEAPQVVDATITQVDTTNSSVTVQTTDKRQGTLKVDSETKITINGKESKLSDLKEGVQAKIAFNRQGKALSIDA
jgi:Cu/Ag efflux protein CusF